MQDFINTLTLFVKANERLICIGAGIIIFLVFMLLRKKLANGILKLCASLLFRRKPEHKDTFISSLLRPLTFFFLILGGFLAIRINVDSAVLVRVFKIATILIISWAVTSYLSDNLFYLFKFGDSVDDKMNATVIKFISNIMKIVIIAIAAVMVISELGYNINGLLTGIGVGGLAVSLAAQDAISNLISGFVIVIDKPFLVGDFIQTGDIQGTVIDITMRSTKIRTLDDSVVTMPNSSIADSDIVNISQIEKRLIDVDLTLTYSTSEEVMKRCQENIRTYLTENELILDYPLRVNFSKLDSSSLNLNIFCYTTVSELNAFLEFYSEINYKLREIVTESGAKFAYPTTSVYIENK